MNITAEDEHGEKVNGNVSVLVRVRDINDNVPYFEHEFYHANVSENLSSGIDVIRLQAVDNDVDSIVRYSIEVNRVNSDGELIFDIDELSGIISTAVCCLDRESIDQFTIKVCATDQTISGDQDTFHWSSSKTVGKNRQSTSGDVTNNNHNNNNNNNQTSCTSVIIDITDENDESPHFVRDKFHLTLPDGVNELYPNRILLNTTVTDSDMAETNRFACRMVGWIRMPQISQIEAYNKNVTNNSNNGLGTNGNGTLNITMHQITTLLRKYLYCEVSENGNVRISIGNEYEPDYFYRSLMNELEMNRHSTSKSTTIPDYIDLLWKVTVTDVGIFEASNDDMSIAIENHLTHAELNVRMATVRPTTTVAANGVRNNNNNNNGNNNNGEQHQKPSVVTKQISPNGYNDGMGDGHGNTRNGIESRSHANLLERIHFWMGQSGLPILSASNGTTTAIILLAILIILLATGLILFLVIGNGRNKFRGRRRRRRERGGGSGVIGRSVNLSTLSNNLEHSIPGAICCMTANGSTGDDSLTFPNGANVSDHLLPCSSYTSTIDGSNDVLTIGFESATSTAQTQQHQSQSLYTYGQLSKQMSTVNVNHLFCHSANSNSNSNSANTNTSSSVLSDNYLIDPLYHQTSKSPSIIDGSMDGNSVHHYSSHHHHHSHALGTHMSTNEYSGQMSNDGTSGEPTAYGFEFNGPYDTIALYDLTHLRTIPFDTAESATAVAAANSLNQHKSSNEIEMNPMCSSNTNGTMSTSQLTIIGLDAGHTQHQNSLNNIGTTGELGVILSPNPMTKQSMINSKTVPHSTKGATECSTTGNFLLIGDVTNQQQ